MIAFGVYIWDDIVEFTSATLVELTTTLILIVWSDTKDGLVMFPKTINKLYLWIKAFFGANIHCLSEHEQFENGT